MRQGEWIRAYKKRRRAFEKRLNVFSIQKELVIKKPRKRVPKKKQEKVRQVVVMEKKTVLREMRRMFRMLANGGSHTELQWQNLLENTGHKCVGCGRTDVRLQKDHIKPVYRGGTDDISNIQPLCWDCNKMKNIQYPYTFEKKTI
jgi:5-methylcytosine-specific restriction endonuclease McrA